MDLSEEEVRDLCTDAVFDRGRTYVAEGRIDRISRFDDELTAVVAGSRRYDSAAVVHRALVESIDDHMELVDGSYDHFAETFTAALDGYVDCVAAADGDVENAVAFLEERAASGTPFLAECFDRTAAELRDRAE